MATYAIAASSEPALAAASITAAATRTAAGARCMPPHGAGPGYDASVGNSANGDKICVHVGERLLVILRAPVTGPDWARPEASARGYVVAAPMTLMLVRGATGANFRAVKTGAVYLRSTRRVCSPKQGMASCDAVQAWSVQLEIAKK